MPVANTEEITELEEISPARVDGVASPASGFPMLLMKAVNSQGGVNEAPDIAAAEGILQDIARLIQSEAAEMAVGNWAEQRYIQLLAEAASLMSYFRAREMDGDEDDGIAKDISTYLAKRKVPADERKRLASEGKALDDGSYPIANAGDLKNAAILARSGHGNVAAAKRLIAKRARELGVANPLADKAEKDDGQDPATEPAQTPADTDPQNGDVGKADVVKAAITEAITPLKDELAAVKADMAKVLAMPIPGGPVQTVPAAIRAQRDRDGQLAKAARYARLAEEVSEPDIRNHYNRL